MLNKQKTKLLIASSKNFPDRKCAGQTSKYLNVTQNVFPSFVFPSEQMTFLQRDNVQSGFAVSNEEHFVNK